jgi:sugar/nucleoside kinase (ribokinase family)
VSLDVLAIGNIVGDFVAAPVKRMPCWGELTSIEQPITLNVGGNAGIFTTWASQLGLNTSLMGKIGDDDIGKLLISKLRTSAVDVSHVKVSQDKPTSVTLVIANDVGERSFFHYPGANAEFGIKDIDVKPFSEAKALLLCSYFIMPGLEGGGAKKILKTARKKGLLTVFDVAWDPHGKWALNDTLKYVDVFIPNEEEILKITKKNVMTEAANEILKAGVKIVAIKMGSKGCYIKNNKGEKFRINAHNVESLDSTGAGDTFNAAFVYGLLSDWNLEKTARFANAAGALSVTQLGGTTASPTKENIEEFINGMNHKIE